LKFLYCNYLLYAGRATSHDVSAFARDSAGTKLVSLGPDDFNPNKVGPSSREPWFVDFFAPVSTYLVFSLIKILNLIMLQQVNLHGA
jgi:hypothetical protein